ncbi:hypothetical protein D9Q98_003784 [Chlorella vulgaris]|uniref:Uncharacterized protein n=1 Tax=Chlorella vulgaris TaxID=3077 RepID=A0A9D4YYE5_CHLVU|nr:hypothetical protein D9Q98_003784 [Chlorella vulgaris]
MWAHARALILAAALVGLVSASPEHRQHQQQLLQQQQQQQDVFSVQPLPTQRCATTVPVNGLQLTPSEEELLQHICWPEDGATIAAETLGASRGVPAGVNCTVVPWCDADGAVCTEVCERGSVYVAPWLAHAIKQQVKLVQGLPLCYATMLGTHNSAITLADGYGNLDEYFQGFFKYIKWALHDFSNAPLHTNNQLLSLTDQLNLGVRGVEVDVHWVAGVMRIAHCGGLHVPLFNKLIDAVNLVARLLHRPIRWDTESLGCQPSLSSIPVLEQRLLTDALQEIRDWMDAPGNSDEFLLLYFDDQPNLQTWGKLGHLLNDTLATFPRSWIFSAEDKEAWGPGWPTQRELLAAGKRLLLVSGTDYGADMQPLIFARGQALCGWSEPSLAAVDGTPQCQVTDQGSVEPRPLFDGVLTRVISCELQYGPMNCDFVWRGTNHPLFDEVTLPPVMGCGLNMPSPDHLTPDRAAATIWSWAPGHPFDPAWELASSTAGGSTVDGSSSRKAAEWLAAAAGRVKAASVPAASRVAAAAANCGVLSAGDSRWRAAPCTLPSLPSACRRRNATLGAADGGWVLNATLARGSCPEGAEYDLPRHPRENYLLAAALQHAGHEAAWLPLHGPEWSTEGWPAAQQQRQPTDKRRVVLHAVLPAAGGLALLALAGGGAVAGHRALLRRRQSPGLYQALG